MAKSDRLDYRGQQLCEKLIRENSEVLQRQGNSIVRYHRGWGDAAVVKALNAQLGKPGADGDGVAVGVGTVERFRRKYVGGLDYADDDALGRVQNPMMRIALQARKRVDMLEPRVAATEDLLQQVCARLGIAVPADFGFVASDVSSSNSEDAIHHFDNKEGD